MDPGPVRDVLTLLVGIATGVLSAAFGVGGAVVSTPALRALGLPALLAVGTTLPSILPSAVSGTARYVREDLVDWRVVKWTAPAGVVSAVGGSLLSRVIPGEGHVLMIMTALLLGFTAYRMAKTPKAAGPAEPPPVANGVIAKPSGPPERGKDTPPVLAGVGVAAGLLSGLLGIGGGVIMVPGFTEVAGIPLKTAIATSLACVGLFAVPGTITHALLGGIDWRFAVLVAIGVIPGARLGAAAAIKATDTRLRLAVAGFLGIVAVAYLVGEVLAL
jgi:uncharacterized protein